MSSLGLKEKIVFTLVGILFFVTSVFVGMYILNMNYLQKKIDSILFDAIVQEKKKEIKNNVEIEKQIIESLIKLKTPKQELKNDLEKIVNTLNTLYAKFKNDPNIKNILIDIVKNTQKDCQSRYFFIFNSKGDIISYPPYFQYSMPSNIYKVHSKSTQNLRKIIQETIKRGKFFAVYEWIDPKTSKITKKLGYFIYFKPLNWIVGEGIYLTHLRAHLLNKIKTLIDIRYGPNFNGYFFALDLKTKKVLFHPLIPDELDYSKYALFQKILQTDGFIEYKAINPSDMKQLKKIAYISTIKELDIKIGTGKYFVNLQEYIKSTANYAQKHINILLMRYILFTLIIFGLIIFISNKILDHLITTPVETIIAFTQEVLQKQEFEKRLHLPRKDEFGELADEINNFLQYIQQKINYYNEIIKRL
ncbi:MAG: hypothetical protein GXO62_04905 [Epsilonproteobacteria bacterium]|nr:hypothetical protein [Campylobacterota bacterium]